MTLSEKQRLFMLLLGRFLVWIHDQGLEVVGGQLQRTQAEADRNAAAGTGISKSLHIKCLAIDLMLFIDGIYKTETEDYRALGEYWESLHTLCRWGGRFSHPDGNHFSLENEGIR